MKSLTILFSCLVLIFLLSPTGNSGVLDDTTRVFPSVIDLNQKPEGFIKIVPPSGVSSFEIKSVVDMNKDGYDDIVGLGISDFVSWDFGYKATIYIIYGSNHLPSVIHLDNPEVEVAKMVWPNANQDLQIQRVTVGDVDGNGFKDILFTADRLIDSAVPDISGQRFATRVYLLLANSVWRGETMLSFDNPNLKEITIFMNEKGGTLNFVPKLIAADFDGDMKDDVAFAVPNKYVNDVPFIGQVYIVHGRSNFPHEFTTEDSTTSITKIQGDTSFGIYNISEGDLDGDSQPDLLIEGKFNRKASWPFQMRGYVDSTVYYKTFYAVYGSVLRGSLFSQPASSLMTQIWGLSVFKSFIVLALYSLYGGDITGDGCDEFFVGYNTTSGVIDEHNKSDLNVIIGSKNYLMGADINKMPSGKLEIQPLNQNEILSYDNVYCADLNSDGYKEALISANGFGSYQFYILFGKPAFPDSLILSAGSPYVTKVTNGDFIACGDINGDGYQDIVGKRTPYVLFGHGEKYGISETITRNITKSKDAFYNFKFANMTDFHFSFTKARIEDSTKMNLIHYGSRLPDSLKAIPAMKKPVAFIQANLMNMGYGTYKLKAFMTYSDSLVNALGINQENLTMSWWDEQNSKWEKIPSIVDTSLNRVSFELDHLSLFALADKTDSLLTDVRGTAVQIPLSFELSQNYPNPFNPGTTIRFQIPKEGDISLRIYNILGQEVKTLLNKKMAAGNYEVQWDGTNNFGQKVSSGIYIYRMETNTAYVNTRKMVFLK